MRSSFWRGLGGLLVLLNWAFFLAVTLLIGVQAGNFDWLYQLHWSSFLTDLAGLLTLTEVPSGSVWLAWLLLSVGYTGVWLARLSPIDSPTQASPVGASASPPRPPDAVGLRQDAIEARPDVQEKLKRLNRWLSQA